MFHRARDIKERINKWEFIKIKVLCTTKENISKIKRKSTIWENIFANDPLDKVRSPKKKKDVHKSTPGGEITQFKKIGIRREQTLLQGGHTQGPETYERMFSITSHQRVAN